MAAAMALVMLMLMVVTTTTTAMRGYEGRPDDARKAKLVHAEGIGTHGRQAGSAGVGPVTQLI